MAADDRETILARLLEQGTWIETDGPILDRLIDNRRDHAHYRKLLSESTAIIEDAKRGTMPNPLIKMIRDVERDIHRDEEHLVLAPKIRIQQRVDHVIQAQEVGIDDLLGDPE